MNLKSILLFLSFGLLLAACSDEGENNLAPGTAAYTVVGDTTYTVAGTATVLFVGDTLAGVTISSSTGVVLAVNIKGDNVGSKGTYSVNNNGVTERGQSNTNLQDGSNTAYSGVNGTIRIDKGSSSDFQGEIRNMTMENFVGETITVNGSFRASGN
jgi:hypothetical protein